MNKNELYPIFLKVSVLEVLIIGAGKVGYEKLSFLLKSSPHAKVTVVAKKVDPELLVLAKKHLVKIELFPYNKSFLIDKHIVIAATNSLEVNLQIHKDCKAKNILVNVADNPAYCDFYMGGIVTKGNIKLAISTNGKSPTAAKRLRQFFEEVLPEDMNDLVENLNEYRQTIQGDFEEKVKKLNDLTKGMLREND
ncbi:bifunctional precorrin-2 dehydrogenase/sirohydrochlorin ferrochelatase [Flavobacteriaceae bacterium AH-315-O20]|nr:bifunctional precorrin-2 dehydrogenase/sirohydrochlorin ferrochelatase [Flavobacteriaceae bacterium AH-315-O20]